MPPAYTALCGDDADNWPSGLLKDFAYMGHSLLATKKEWTKTLEGQNARNLYLSFFKMSPEVFADLFQADGNLVSHRYTLI